MRDRILVLQVYTTDELEKVRHVIVALLKGIQRWCKWKEMGRLVSFAIVTQETPLEFRRRINDLISDKPEIGGTFCFTVPVGDAGELEPLRFYIDCARTEIRERNSPDNVRNLQRRVFGRKS